MSVVLVAGLADSQFDTSSISPGPPVAGLGMAQVRDLPQGLPLVPLQHHPITALTHRLAGTIPTRLATRQTSGN